MEATGYALEPVLRTVARTTSACLGYRTAVINLHRPAWDDFETVVVEGSDEAREVLLGQVSTMADWEPLLDPRFERRGAFLIEHGSFDWSQDRMTSYVPESATPEAPGGWHPEDALFVPLRSTAGELLGVLSVDEPADGRRPSAEQLDLLVGLSQHAALALEHAQQAAAAERQRAAVDHLLRLTASLASRRTTEEMLDGVCAGVHDALGFQMVSLSLVDEAAGEMVMRASIGLSPQELARLGRVPIEAVSELLDPVVERDGVVLLEHDEARARVDETIRDVRERRRSGSGSRAWRNHALLVPLRDRDERLLGVLWADEPEDRLLPTRELLQALRAFAHQAMSAIEAARQLELMRHLAEHDPLTGLRNRRGLQEHIDAEIARVGAVAVLVCDLDHFKRVNDVLGYERGDEALRRVAGVLARAGGLAARLGGEEFALVLPGAGERAALAAGERIRAAVLEACADFPWAITTSVGVAVSGPGAETATLLLRAATRAVFGAKRLGRDRCVAYRDETLELRDARSLTISPRAAVG